MVLRVTFTQMTLQHLSQGSTLLRASKTSAQPGENGASEGLSKFSPDVLKLFGETQRNLLELNRSRLNALDELREAKYKISELGEIQQSLACLLHQTTPMSLLVHGRVAAGTGKYTSPRPSYYRT